MADPSDGETAPAGLAASTEWLSSKGKPPQPNAFPVMAEPSTDEDESAEPEPAVPHLRASAVGSSKPPEGSGATRSRRGGKPLVSALAVLVISAGGTMNREAVALGTPVWTTFEGRLGAVDEQLIASGRLRRLERAEDVVLVKRDPRDAPERLRRDPEVFTDLFVKDG